MKITATELNDFVEKVVSISQELQQALERIKELEAYEALNSKLDLQDAYGVTRMIVERFLDDNYGERHPDLDLREIYHDNGIDTESKDFYDCVLWITMRWSKRTRKSETKEGYFIREVTAMYGNRTRPDKNDHHYGYRLYEQVQQAYIEQTKILEERDFQMALNQD